MLHTILQRRIQAINIMEQCQRSYLLSRPTSYGSSHRIRIPALLFTAFSVVAVFCGLTSLSVTAQAQTPNPAPPTPIATAKQEPAKTLGYLTEGDRELKGGATHSYRIQMSTGQFFHGLVEQKGIDVVVVLYRPDGDQFGSADSPNDRSGTEPILFVAETTGDYRVDIRSPNERAAPGVYGIKIVAQREASSVDRGYSAAQRALEEGAKLRAQPDASSKRAAIEKDKLALPLFQAAGDTYRQAFTLRGLGLAHAQLNEFRAALPFFSEARLLAQRLGNTGLEASMETFLGGAFDVLGEIEQSLDHYQRALTLAKADRNQLVEANALNNIGKIHNDLGEWQKALEYYLEALPLFRSVGNKRNEAVTLNNLGVAYSLAGEQGRALDYLQQSLPLLRASGDKNAESYTLTNIGDAYRRLNDYQAALKYYDQAQVIQRETGNRAQQAETVDFVGVTYTAMGQPAKALEYHQQAIKIYGDSGNPRRRALQLNNLGHVYNLLVLPDKALENFNQALKVLRDLGDLNSVAVVLEGSARAEVLRGNLIEASKNIEESLNLIETVRVASGGQDLRAAYLASREKAYEFNLDLLMQRNARDPGKGYDAAALSASERSRGRSLLELLNEAKIDIREGVDADLVKKEREIKQSLNAKAQRQIQLTAQKGNQQEIATLDKEIGGLEDQYQQVQVAIRKASPAYAALTQPLPLSLREIQLQLDPNTLLLEYSLGDDRSYLWAVTRDSLKSYQLPGRERIQKAAREVYGLLTNRSLAKAGETAAQKRGRLTEIDTRLVAASYELSQLVLGPVAAELGTKRLVVVADDALQYVPFAALPAPSVVSGQLSVADKPKPGNALRTTVKPRQPTSGFRPLVLDHEIISLPSASSLAVQRKNLLGRKLATNAVAVMADPVFSSADDRLKAKSSGLEPRKTQTAGDDGGSTRIIEHLADGGGAVIKRLPFTRQEANQILAVAPQVANLKALDFQASRATATSADLSHYRYVHFATHGYLDSERPNLSALVLSLVDEKGMPQDGFLRTLDIYNLKLPAELVVLSACETGLGKEIKREGLDGITRGFMYAGARRVVVSLWNVNDKATAELMQRFYRGMLREKRTPAASLRNAQAEMSQQRQWQSPYYWAAFVMQGEWR